MRQLLDHLGLADVVLAGHCFGAMVALLKREFQAFVPPPGYA